LDILFEKYFYDLWCHFFFFFFFLKNATVLASKRQKRALVGGLRNGPYIVIWRILFPLKALGAYDSCRKHGIAGQIFEGSGGLP